MGLKDFLQNYKEKRRLAGVKKNIARLGNKHQLSENRYIAADALNKDGSAEALAGLLQRFNFAYENTIKDKAEKEYVSKLILNRGPDMIPIVKSYIRSSENIAWPLQILGELTTREDVLSFLLSILSDEDSTFKEDVLEKRLDLLNYLAEFRDKAIVDRVISFLGDEEEEVRFKAIEVLGKQRDERAREPILKLLVSEEESVRIKMKILEVLMETNWSVSGFRRRVEEILPDGYYLTRDGNVKLRGKIQTNL